MDDLLAEELLRKSEEDFSKYRNLPFAVYITYKNGDILRYNDKAIELLHLKQDDRNKANINDFYAIKGERERLIQELEKYPDNTWKNNETLNFKVNKDIISLRFFAKTFKNTNNIFLGTICLVFKITEFERFRVLEKHVPVGFFEISENNIVTNSNEKFREILGLSEQDLDVNIIDHIAVSSLYSNYIDKESIKKNIYIDIIKELKLKIFIEERIIDFVKKDGVRIAGKVNLIVEEMSDDGRIYKVKGFLEDVTFKEILEDMQDLHVGLFTVKEQNNSLIVTHCNEFFSSIFDVHNTKRIIDMDFEKLINSKIDYKLLHDKLMSGNNISNYLVKSQVGNKVKDLSIHIKKINRNNSTKYAGAIYDVTNDVERNLQAIKLNFGSFLHSYSAMSNNIKDTLQSIIDAHGTNVVQNSNIDKDLAFKKIRDHINGFISAYKKYSIEAISKGFSSEYDRDINTHINKINKKLYSEGISKVSVAFIRNTFISIRNIIEQKGPNSIISNEIYKPLLREIIEIFRFSRLLSLYYLETETYDMTIDIEEFKETLRANATVPENKKFYLMNAVNRAKQSLEELADRKNVEIKMNIPHQTSNIMVMGDERNLFTAIYNIINNAIKYSWSNFKNEEKQSIVNIYVRDEALFVLISITNIGVGIKKSDIESRELFKFGNRGQYTTDKKRKGNGIGLWHANNIITQFNGELEINSEPLDLNFPEDFKRPFNTVVTISIPYKQS